MPKYDDFQLDLQRVINENELRVIDPTDAGEDPIKDFTKYETVCICH